MPARGVERRVIHGYASSCALLRWSGGWSLRRFSLPVSGPPWTSSSCPRKSCSLGTPDERFNCGQVVFCPDGKFAATHHDTVMRLGDVATGREVRRFPSGSVASLAFSPDGRVLISHNCQDVVAWDVASGRRLRALRLPAKSPPPAHGRIPRRHARRPLRRAGSTAVGLGDRPGIAGVPGAGAGWAGSGPRLLSRRQDPGRQPK